MDTKKLFLKTQKNLINWGLGISFCYALLLLFYFFKIPKTPLSLLNLLIGLFLFASMVMTRLSLRPKFALLALASLGGQLVISLVDTTMRFKQIVETFKNFQGPKWILFFSVFMGYFIYFLGLYLYYKVYKATCYAKELHEL